MEDNSNAPIPPSKISYGNYGDGYKNGSDDFDKFVRTVFPIGSYWKTVGQSSGIPQEDLVEIIEVEDCRKWMAVNAPANHAAALGYNITIKFLKTERTSRPILGPSHYGEPELLNQVGMNLSLSLYSFISDFFRS
jgi:hypothetical protein